MRKVTERLIVPVKVGTYFIKSNPTIGKRVKPAEKVVEEIWRLGGFVKDKLSQTSLVETRNVETFTTKLSGLQLLLLPLLLPLLHCTFKAFSDSSLIHISLQ